MSIELIDAIVGMKEKESLEIAKDLLDSGKDIVVFMLDVNGFEVIDLGIDVPVQKFVEAIKESAAPVVGLSGFFPAHYGESPVKRPCSILPRNMVSIVKY